MIGIISEAVLLLQHKKISLRCPTGITRPMGVITRYSLDKTFLFSYFSRRKILLSSFYGFKSKTFNNYLFLEQTAV